MIFVHFFGLQNIQKFRLPDKVEEPPYHSWLGLDFQVACPRLIVVMLRI